MKTEKIFFRCVSILLMVCLLLSGCGAAENTAVVARISEETVQTTVPTETLPATETTAAAVPEEPKQEISVAIYPYIPNVELFEELLLQSWKELEPDVVLKLEQWDCYSGPSDCDVLMYDTIALSYLAENGYVQPIEREEIADADGILPFAMEGITYEGKYYGAPYFVCGDFLIYDREDAQLDAVENFPELLSVVTERRKQDKNTGVLMNFEVDYPYHYLEASVDCAGEYSSFEEMPDCFHPNQEALKRLRELGSVVAVLPEEAAGEEKGDLFEAGYGIAFYGVSEKMSYMEDILDQLNIKTISLAEGENIPLYYTDITSVSTHVTDPEKIALCKKLMNMVASREFLEKMCFENGEAQYLLPARQDVYLSAAEEYPMYGKLHELVMNDRNRVFRFGVDFYQYLENAEKAFS